MLFNLHNGQVRFSSIDTGNKPIFRPKMKVGHISMGRINTPRGDVGHNGGYQTDKMGNIDVTIPFHIETMIGQGWPLYNGDGKTYPVPQVDLLYPNMNLDSLYWRKINEGKNLRSSQ